MRLPWTDTLSALGLFTRRWNPGLRLDSVRNSSSGGGVPGPEPGCHRSYEVALRLGDDSSRVVLMLSTGPGCWRHHVQCG